MGILQCLFGRRPTWPILEHDDEHPEVMPDAALAALIRGELRDREIVSSWYQSENGDVDVTLIHARLVALQEQARANGGPVHLRDGGSGRSLHYRYQEGEWHLIGLGDWRS